MIVVGIHDGHNASACLLEDGTLKYAIQEERLTNEKNFAGFPFKSVNKISEMIPSGVDGIDVVAMASNHVAKPFGRDDIINAYKKSGSSDSKIREIIKKTPLYSAYKKSRTKDRLKSLQKLGIPETKVIFVDHHLCHASTAYFTSPWINEKVLVLTNDGSGDGLCSTVYIGENGSLSKIAETPKGNSIGNIYSRTTFMMGFVPLEHEFKLMGMAPYASEKGIEIGYNIFKDLLYVPDASLEFKRKIPEPTHLIYPRLRNDTEFIRFDWTCAGLQKVTEDLLCKWVMNCIEKTGLKKIAVSGGTFMNVKANKRIMELNEVDSLYVAPSCGDESNSIGAAYYAYAQYCKDTGSEVDITPPSNLYLGDCFTDEDAEITIQSSKNGSNFDFERVDNIEKRVSELLSEGKIVARCSGRMEFGARALGNRSILADASNLDSIRTINMMVKKRDFWMPFAPTILANRSDAYILNPKGIPSPYMMLSFETTEKRNEFIAGVHQADLTARAQILEEDFNPEYFNVISEFERKTGRSVVLNTSFNLHGYPIVNGPAEAMWVFENSGLEYMALGNYLIQKNCR